MQRKRPPASPAARSRLLGLTVRGMLRAVVDIERKPLIVMTRALASNVRRTDRALRLAIGSLLLGLGWAYGSWWGLIGLVPLLTGAARFCPLYRLVGVDTCRSR